MLAVVPGMLSTAFDLFERGTLHADGIAPSTLSTPCTNDQVQIWLWDTYTSLWGRRCVAAGKTILSSEGDIVAVPNSANLPPAMRALIDETVDVAALTAGASVGPDPLSNYVSGQLKKSTTCTNATENPLTTGVGCDKGPTARICPHNGEGCDEPSVPYVTLADAQAGDTGGSVGLHALSLIPSGGGSPISITWDVSRWAKGDVFAGLHGGMLKVYDRDFQFKRYIALSDYARYGTWNEATGTLTVPGPNSSLPTENPVQLKLPYVCDGPGCATNPTCAPSEDPDQSCEFYQVSPDLNDLEQYRIGKYVAGCGVDFKSGNVYVTNADWYDPGVNVIGRQRGSGELPYSDLSRRISTRRRASGDLGGLPIDIAPESVKFDADRNMYVGHSGGYFNPAGDAIDIDGIRLFADNGHVYDDGSGSLAAQTGHPVSGGNMSARLDPANGLAPFWENQALAWANRNLPNPFTWLTYQFAPREGQKVPFRRQYGSRLQVYSYNGSGWDPLTVHSPFISQAGTDWIDLTAPTATPDPPTVLYTSEYGDIYRFKPGTGQESNLNARRLHPGKIHALRLLPPGDGKDMIVAAVGEPEQNLLMRVQIIGTQTHVTEYTVAEVQDTPPPFGTGRMGQPFWYAIDISPDGKTMWAFPFKSGDLYQIDIATGQYEKRTVATFSDATQYDGQGLCIMWQYNTQQEICNNGIDDDDNGLVDENCQTIQKLSNAGSRPVARDDAYAMSENTTLTVASALGTRFNDGTEFNRYSLTTELVSSPSNGDASFGTAGLTLNADGSFSYRPAAGFHGLDTFTYKVSDVNGESAPATVRITVSPRVADDTYAVSHTGSLSGIVARDPNGLFANDSIDLIGTAYPLAISKVGPSASVELAVGAGTSFPTVNNGAVTIGPNGNFTYTPSQAFVGTDHFYYRANDGQSDALNANTSLYGPSATFAKVTITVSNGTVPTAADNTYSTNAWTPLLPDGARDIRGNDADVDGDPLRVSALIVGGVDYSDRIGGPTPTGMHDTCLVAGGQLKLWWNGRFEYNAQGSGCAFANAPVTVSFQYRVTDGHSQSNLATVFINVSGNQPPVAFDNGYRTSESVRLLSEPSRNILLNSDANGEEDFDSDAGDTFGVSAWWYNNPLDPEKSPGEPWDCAVLDERSHCLQGPISAAAANDTCIAHGGSLKVWANGSFDYDPRNSGCPYTLGPRKQSFWYVLQDDKGGVSNVARVDISITAPLVIKANSKSRLYAGANPAFDFVYVFRDLLFTPAVGDISGTAVCGTAAVQSTAVGNYPITCSGLTSERYDLTYQQGNLEVLRAPLTITADPQFKDYNGSPFTGFTSTPSGFLNGDTAAVLSGTLIYGGPAASSVNAGAHQITVGGVSAQNYAITFVPGTLTINKVGLTVTAENKNKTYDGLVFPSGSFTSLITGFVNGEGPSVLGGALSYSGAAVTAVAVNTTTGYAIVPAGLTATNYTFTYVAGKLTIQPIPVRVVVTGGTFPYNGLARSATCQVVDLDGEVLPLTGTLSYSPSGVTNAGSYEASCSFAGDATHGPATSTSPAIVTITPVELTVTADDKTKVYDRQPFAPFTVSYSGFVNGETSNVLGGTLSFGGAAVGAVNVNLAGYQIVPSGHTSTNYSPITYRPGVLKITPASLVITASNLNKTFGALLTFAGTEFTSTGLFAPDAVSSLTLQSPGTPTTANVGSYLITPSGAGGPGLTNYDIQYSVGTLTVKKATPTVTVTSPSVPYDGLPHPATCSVTSALGGSLGSGTLTYVPALTVNAGSYTATCNFPGDADHEPATGSGSVTITKRQLTVKAVDQDKIYNGLTFPVASFTSDITGFVNNEAPHVLGGALTYSGPAVTAVAVNTTPGYDIVPAGLTATNYTFVYQSGKLRIARAPLTITADDQSKVYNRQPFTAFTSSYSGFVNGEGPSVLSGTLSYSGTAIGAINAAAGYTIIPSGVTAQNYTISFGAGTLEIEQAPLIVKANNATKLIGVLLNFAGNEFTTNGLFSPDAVTSVTLTSAGSGVAALAGAYDIVPSAAVGSGLANYDITYQNGVLTVFQSQPCPTTGTTYTQGGWGSEPSGSNPGALLASKFSQVYPQGVTIGGTRWIKFTSASAISAFLPAGGNAGVLTQASATNPTSSSGGVFAGQILALQLNVDFSRNGVTTSGLDNFIVSTGPLSGKTVGEVLATANAVLGGASLPSGVTIADLNAVADAINQNFDNGTTDNGDLTPPCSPCNAGTFMLTGSSSTSGTAGNIRTFTKGSISVKASAFSRTTNGVWNTAYLGAYSMGLGVTDGSEGSGGNDTHAVDNTGRYNYVLFEFSTPVVVSRALLNYIGSDSDISVWIGTKNNPFVNHLTLSTSLLNSLATETNNGDASDDVRWADINAAELTGNVLVIAAHTASTNDSFKLGRLELSCQAPNEEPTNEAPSAAADSYSTNKNTPLNVSVPGVLSGDSDPDGDSLSAVLATQPAHGDVMLSASGGFTYIPDTGYYGTDTFTYKAQDPSGAQSAPATVMITVMNSTQTQLTANNDSYDVDMNGYLYVPSPGVLENDGNGNEEGLMATNVTQPTNGSLWVGPNGGFVYIPSNGFIGTDTFTYKALDSDGTLSNTATVTITVEGPPAPTVANDSYVVKKSKTLTVSAPGVAGNDTTTGTVTVQLISPPSRGTLTLNADGSFTYKATSTTGAVTFTYRVKDASGLWSNIATVTITVTN